MNNFTFDGIKKDYIRIIERGRPYSAPRNINLIKVAGLKGGYVKSIDVDPIIIPMTIRIEADSPEQLQERSEELTAWLVQDEEKELWFDDRYNRSYWALVQGAIEPEETVSFATATFEFICPRPYKFGNELVAKFNSDFVKVQIDGTEETEPLFELEVLKPITYALVQNHEDDYIMAGLPYDVEKAPPFKRYERLLYSDAKTLTGWTTHDAVDGGSVAGQMESSGERFQAASYGTGKAWHGPAVKASLPETVKDFRLQAWVSLYNGGNPAYVGRVEIYLLDVNGNNIGKIAMKDTASSSALGYGEARAGDNENNHYIISEYGDKRGNWNNFGGIIRLERENNIWTGYIAKTDTETGRHHTRRLVTFDDTTGRYSAPVAQVVVHVGQFGSHVTPTMGVYSIFLDKINQEPDAIPYIAEAGDIITFDHSTSDILINGESRMDLIDFGSEFFTLKTGENQLIVNPFEAFNTKVYYREKYK